jgi:hypothetical protein
VIARIQVLNEDEHHSGVNRQRVKEFLVRFRAAGRPADHHLQEKRGPARRHPSAQTVFSRVLRFSAQWISPSPDARCSLRAQQPAILRISNGPQPFEASWRVSYRFKISQIDQRRYDQQQAQPAVLYALAAMTSLASMRLRLSPPCVLPPSRIVIQRGR